MRPGGGTIAAAAGLVLKPTPGTLSKGAASRLIAAYVRRRASTFGSAGDPISFIFARTSSALSGVDAATTRTPICSGSVQPAAS